MTAIALGMSVETWRRSVKEEMEVTKITTSLEKKNMQEKTKMTVDVWDKSMKTWRR